MVGYVPRIIRTSPYNKRAKQDIKVQLDKEEEGVELIIDDAYYNLDLKNAKGLLKELERVILVLSPKI